MYFSDFTITIAFDVIRSRGEKAFSDYSDQVSRRMGFIPIPLTILLIRVITQTFDFTVTSVQLFFCELFVIANFGTYPSFFKSVLDRTEAIESSYVFVFIIQLFLAWMFNFPLRSSCVYIFF